MHTGGCGLLGEALTEYHPSMNQISVSSMSISTKLLQLMVLSLHWLSVQREGPYIMLPSPSPYRGHNTTSMYEKGGI